MEDRIKESDWKIFRELSRVVLNRFCERVLDDVARIAANTQESHHERYLEIYRLMRERDKTLAKAFDGPSRSAALIQLMIIVRLDLLRKDELERFSPEMQRSIENCRDVFGD